jgi:autotransporter passenger strand-loop-strand repeat protein
VGQTDTGDLVVHLDELNVPSGGTTIDTVVGGVIIVESGATASGTVIGAMCEEVVNGNCIDEGASVSGIQVVEVASAVSSGTTIYAGGFQDVGAGGVASVTVVSGGREQIDFWGRRFRFSCAQSDGV